MKALITGASSGIGYSIACELAKRKIDLVIVARRENKLLDLKEKLKKNYNINVDVEPFDVSITENIDYLVNKYNDIDILINNAGFGYCDDFIDIPLEKELAMIDVNIKALHIFTKKYLTIFKERNHGYILNVASVASFMPGPKMATYYATKSYVRNLSEAIRYELKKEKSKVTISTLCPGPTKTEFEKIADVKFKTKLTSSEKVAFVAIKKMFKGKSIILPDFQSKFIVFGTKFIPKRLLLKLTYKIQNDRKF